MGVGKTSSTGSNLVSLDIIIKADFARRIFE